MKLTMLAKDDKSGRKDFPSVYVADTGELVIQGAEVTGDEKLTLANPRPGETAVRIAPEIVLRAVDQYKRNGAQ